MFSLCHVSWFHGSGHTAWVQMQHREFRKRFYGSCFYFWVWSSNSLITKKYWHWIEKQKGNNSNNKRITIKQNNNKQVKTKSPLPVLKSTWKTNTESMSIQKRLKGNSWDHMNGDAFGVTTSLVTYICTCSEPKGREGLSDLYPTLAHSRLPTISSSWSMTLDKSFSISLPQ